MSYAPPPSSPFLLLLFFFLPAHMKDLVAADTHCARGLQGKRKAYGGRRERERETEMDWFPPPAPSVQSQLAVQRLGRTRHVPGQAQLPVCGQDLAPRGASVQAGGTTSPTFRQTEGKGVRGHERTHAQTRVSYTHAVKGKNVKSVNQPEFTIIMINWPLTPAAL